jgi:hypothetical protein
MYITINGTEYANVSCYFNPMEIVYTGDSLVDIESVIGPIGVYANDGFLLREDNPSDYLRQIIHNGAITLTNLPEPEPEPEPPEPDPDMWDELAAAIKDGVNHVE